MNENELREEERGEDEREHEAHLREQYRVNSPRKASISVSRIALQQRMTDPACRETIGPSYSQNTQRRESESDLSAVVGRQLDFDESEGETDSQSSDEEYSGTCMQVPLSQFF